MEDKKMKKVCILLSTLLLVLLSTPLFAARWDGATVDMSGGSSSGSNICDQPRPIFDTGKAMMWDSMCGGNNTPTPQPQVTDPYEPSRDNSQPEELDWDKWQEEFNRDWDQPADDRQARERYNREVKKWANDFSHWLVYSMPAYFNYHPDTAANLFELRNALYDANLRGRVQRCLANSVANDTNNVKNLMNQGNDDRLIGYHVMAINNCYRQVR